MRFSTSVFALLTLLGLTISQQVVAQDAAPPDTTSPDGAASPTPTPPADAGGATLTAPAGNEKAEKAMPDEAEPLGQTPRSCESCHNEKASPRPPGPPNTILKRSVHADLDCTDCHGDLSSDKVNENAPKPHGENVKPVKCADCHEEQAKVYTKHGSIKVGEDPDIPSCQRCHGTHEILGASDPHSHVHPINLPNTCRSCHTNVDLLKKREFLREGPIKLYETSVHGQASKKGLYVAATCNDCHSSPDANGKRTAHRILSAGDPESTIQHFNIPNTCGQCHQTVAQDYWDGIHGKLVKRGHVDSPVCTHCHGEHSIFKVTDPRSHVSAARVAEVTCAPCHESETLNEKYGIPAGRLRSYVDSYHGVKAKAGDVRVANCASCHGAHRILPHTDKTSSIHPSNLQETCGDCHPGIAAEIAQTPIHATSTGIKTGWPEFFTTLYMWMIAITIGLMLLHNLADLVRHIIIMRGKPYVMRMTPHETLQHWLLSLTFIVLVVSGFALRFSEGWWVQILFGWGDGRGFELRGTVHRVAAVLFMVSCVWHLIYLTGRRGRRAMRDMMLAKRDVADVVHNALFFLGVRKDKPQFERFSYMEKAEYWALVWGAIIMSVTGLVLWFDNYFVEELALPKGILDVGLVIHYYEAWLATLAIAVWHGYSVIFSPHVFPMNPAWLTGTMPKAMYQQEHPNGPRLKARIRRVIDEDSGEEEEFLQGATKADKPPPRPTKDDTEST